MKIKVSFFAQSREIAGQGQMEFELREGETVSGLFKLMQSRFPELASLHLMAAVNMAYAENSHVLQDSDDVAIIPPVSGG